MFSEECDSIEDQLELLQQYASMTSMAIQNAQLLQQIRIELSQSRALLKLSEEIAKSENLEGLLEIAAGNLISHFNCETVSAWQINKGSLSGLLGGWENSNDIPTVLSSSALIQQESVLVNSFNDKDTLSSALSKMRFLSMPYIELNGFEAQGPAIVLLLDRGELWGLVQIQCDYTSYDANVSYNNLRSAIGQIAVAASLQRTLKIANFRAGHDELTGLPNRSSLDTYLKANIDANSDSVSRLAVFFIDLDGFKEVNDTLGHAAGDELLIEVASRFKSVVNESGMLARVGGDEFALAVRNVGKDECEKIASALIASLNKPFNLKSPVNVGASIGISQMEASNTSLSDLLAQADKSMYLAKSKGKNRFEVWPSNHASTASTLLPFSSSGHG